MIFCYSSSNRRRHVILKKSWDSDCAVVVDILSTRTSWPGKQHCCRLVWITFHWNNFSYNWWPYIPLSIWATGISLMNYPGNRPRNNLGNKELKTDVPEASQELQKEIFISWLYHRHRIHQVLRVSQERVLSFFTYSVLSLPKSV